MIIIRDLAEAQLTGPTVLTIGTFDGVHRGHQALLARLQAAAARHRARSAVIAFHPRPKAVLSPNHPNKDYLTTVEERITRFEKLGLDALIVTPFTRELAQTSAYDFMKFLSDRLNLVELWAGHDFALGKNREGNIEKLAGLGRELHYELSEFSSFLIEGEIVSSTGIRNRLLAGDVRGAARYLGYYPVVNGPIVEGAKRGRTIGFPTANFEVPEERLIPANGVYATFVQLPGDSRRYASVTNVGIRPSFEGETRTVETYIFDFNDTLYGRQLTLEFVERLRAEQKFSGIDELVAQIRRDADQARALLADEVPLAV
jgi:riboflavin kinase/FMN adenylyltransferase